MKLLCVLALLTAGCQTTTEARREAFLKRYPAFALTNGQARFPDGKVVFAGPRSADEVVDQIGKRMLEAPVANLEDLLRRLQEARNREDWTTPLRLTNDTGVEHLPGICDDYMRFFVLLRVAAFPRKMKTLTVNATDESGGAIGTCRYRIDDGKLYAEATDERLSPGVKLAYLDLGPLGRPLLGRTVTIRRFDMQRPIREFLLVVPRDRADSVSMLATIEAVAKRLYPIYRNTSSIAFTLALGGSESNSYKLLGMRRDTVQLDDGGILQLEGISVRIVGPDPATGALSAGSVQLVVEVASPELAQHMLKGTVKEYVASADFTAHARLVIDAVGDYAAERFGLSSIAVVSSVTELAKGGRVKIQIPAHFLKQDGEWVFQRPTKPLDLRTPNEEAQPSI